MKTYDFIVVGSGISGLSFALRASKHGTVAIVTKRKAARTNTAWAQGGIACVQSDDDSFDRHVADTLDAGAGLCPEPVVRKIVSDGPHAIEELIQWGVDFDGTVSDGGGETIDLGREGGHTRRRILHHKDVTGMEMERALLEAIKKSANIKLISHCFVLDIITQHHLGYLVTKSTPDIECYGVYILDLTTKKIEKIAAKITMLAAGGNGQVYRSTTNPAIATGDGLLWVTSLQLEKRKEIDWASFLNGNQGFLGARLG